jgi:hypothetical protein
MRMVILQMIINIECAAEIVLIKPSMPILLPAYLNVIGEIENSQLMYFHNKNANFEDIIEIINNAMAEYIKNNFYTHTMTKVN